MQQYEEVSDLARHRFSLVSIVQGTEDKILYVLKRTNCIPCRSKSSRLRMAYAAQEARFLSFLKHAHIIQGFDFFVDGNDFCSIQELCAHGDMQKFIDMRASQQQFCEERTVRRWFAEIMSAVHFLHSKAIIHRDLKPANVFLTGPECCMIIKLGDFGGARKLKSPDEQIRTDRVGTQHYMAPEIQNRKEYSRKADIWSVGVILIELCLLRTQDSAKLFSARTELCDSLSNSYSRVKNIVRVMIHYDAKDRPDAGQILNSLMLDRPSEPESFEPARQDGEHNSRSGDCSSIQVRAKLEYFVTTSLT